MELAKIVLAIVLGAVVIFALQFLMKVSEEEAEEMGYITPKKARDPETQEILRQTAFSKENEREKIRETEKKLARENADEAGVVPPR